MSDSFTLRVLTYNTLFAGRDRDDDRRAQAQIELINQIAPTVLLMQEAKGFEAGGGALLHALEAQIGMRGFLAPAPRTGQNAAIFIREPLAPIRFEADGANFHHVLASLEVGLPGGRPMTLLSAHLCPNGPAVRRREAAHLAVKAAPDALVLLTGDFNSASPYDPAPPGFDALPLHHRARYLADDLVGADTSVMASLGAAGWIDVGHALGDQGPTVPTAAFAGTEFPVMRCDYVLATTALAAFAKTYAVLRSPLTDAASDHYPVLASFEVTP